MDESTDAFYLKQSEPNRSCFLAMRDIILKSNPEMVETQKYGMACFQIGKKPVFYLWKDKKTGEPYLLVVDGNKLEHPKLESGNRSRMKIYRLNPIKDLPLTEIYEIFNLVYQLE